MSETEFFSKLVELLGVNPFEFLAVTVIVLIVTAAVRRAARKIEGEDWWKLALTFGAMIVGVVCAFLAQLGGFYQGKCPGAVAFVGLWNGLAGMGLWSIAKRIPWVRKKIIGDGKE